MQNLNCRSGPGTEYSVVGAFANGTELSWSVFGEDKYDNQGRLWLDVGGYSVQNKYINGYVLDAYVEKTDTVDRIGENEKTVINPMLPNVG